LPFTWQGVQIYQGCGERGDDIDLVGVFTALAILEIQFPCKYMQLNWIRKYKRGIKRNIGFRKL